ncbi:MAG: LemA family protein [Alphaproteobacteria bacterium]|nr:LemA family protein [Alphaproteobacteria bacterium]
MKTAANEESNVRSLRRVRKDEELLSQLYVVDTPTTEPDRRTVRIALILSIVAVLGLVATLFLRYNTFITMREEVIAKHSNLDAAIQRRENLFGNLVMLTLSHASLEHSIFGHTSDKRAQSLGADADKAGALAGLEKMLGGGGLRAMDSGALSGMLGRLMAVVEQYPNIQSAETYKQMMNSLVDIEDRVLATRNDYNNSASLYNAAITKWPWDYFAYLTGFKRFEYFQPGSERAAPIISKDMIKTLLPSDQKNGEGQ